MKRIVGIGVLILSTCISVFSQVDTTYIYNTSMPYGTLDLRLAKSATRYYYLQEDTTFSYRESSPGVRSTTYRDMTSWDSSPYKQGNLREKNGGLNLFVMNYRIIFPQGYNPSYDPGYPVILMLHGAGEAGNCWGDNCHWATRSWDPNANNPAAPSTELELLNNDRNLFHGGQIHMNAVKAAGTKSPNDPSIPSTAFPGIVIFPQSLNGWSQPSKVEDAIRILRLIIKKYNIDQNRVYIHGLSNGGGGVNQALKRAPWLFACSATMSAVTDGEIVLHGQMPEAKKIPMWIFQGGQDSNPTPSRTFNFVKKLRDAGAVVRYYLYPNLGHGTWNTAYKEPDFFPWLLKNRKYNPHISYGNPVICNTTGTGVKITFSNGFFAYQWEKDGVIIEGENTSELVANSPGVYRGRFSRVANPEEHQWEPWSDPINVTAISPLKPAISVTGTTHLRGPGLSSTEANNTVVLEANETADLYEWYKNGQLINFLNTDIDDTLKVAKFTTGSTSANGAYTLVIKNSYCPSPPSDPVYLFFNNSAPVNLSINSAAMNFKGLATASSVFLTWNDALTTETGYEIWRRKSGNTDFKFVMKTNKDAVSYLDQGLEPGTLYEYKIRAINNSGRSNYLPADNVNTNYQVKTLADVEYPSPPQNVRMLTNDIHAISLSWDPAADNVGIKEYIIRYGDTQVIVPATPTSYTLTGLEPNTLYPITIAASDYAGHISESSNQVLGTTYVLNLKYKHSTGAWTDLDDTTLTKTFIHPEFQGTVENFTLAPRTQEDFFNFQFTGYLNIANDGKYLFRITSDDGSRLIIDSVTVVDNDGKHGNKTVTSDSVFLTAGLHSLEVQYFDNNGFHNLVVQYAGDSIADGHTFINIPDAALKSGSFTPPQPPDAPVNPVATTAGMQQVNISWEFADADSIAFEVYRSTNESGPFSMIGRAEEPSIADSVGLQPGTMYYYKVRTVTDAGTSGYTTITSATTTPDDIVPGTPTNLQVLSKTYETIAMSWSAPYDNVGVTKYEIYANDVLIGTSSINSFSATDLTGITYSFVVKAYDASGNTSAFSQPLVIDNTISGMFYSLPSGNLNQLGTWRKQADGTGPSPTSFATAGQTFVIKDRATSGIGGDWTIGSGSRIVVPDGSVLSVDHRCNCAIELQGAGTLVLDDAITPTLVNISETSTVHIKGATFIPALKFGHLVLSGSAKTFAADTVTVLGNLIVNNDATFTNAAILKIYGNVNVDNTSPDILADADFVFSSNALHTVQAGGDLAIRSLVGKTNASISINTQEVATLSVGSLQLSAGSTLRLGANHMAVDGNGINTGGGTGAIAINGGDIRLSATANSHLYFDSGEHKISSLLMKGSATVHTPVDIEYDVTIMGGILNSGGQIRLLSTGESTASIRRLENGATITGEMMVQKYLPLQGKIWRDLSTSVDGVTVAALQNYFPVTGNFAGASAGDTLGTDPSMFAFSTTRTEIPFPAAGGSNAATLERGKGYSVFMHSLNDSSATVLQTTGVPYQGNIPFTLNAGTSWNDGWNLVGNPYASRIVWNESGWVRSAISPVIAVRDSRIVGGELVEQYRYHHVAKGDGIIEAGQAFWVHAGSNPALTINENAKIDDAYSPGNAPGDRYIVATLQSEDISESVSILLADNGSDGYDINDGVKIPNRGTFSFSAKTSDGVAVAVNSLSTQLTCSKIIPLVITDAKAGTYTMVFENVDSFSGLQIMLIDAVAHTQTPVTSTPLTFALSGDGDSERFALMISDKNLDLDSPTPQNASACYEENTTVVLANSQTGVEYWLTKDSETVGVSAMGTGGDVSFALPFQSLTAGANVFAIRAAFPGCQGVNLSKNVTVSYSPKLTADAPDQYSVCRGQSVTLVAGGAPPEGTYRWYRDSGSAIENNSGNSLVVSDVVEETSYHVEIVTSAGCKSEQAKIRVIPLAVDDPVISRSGDTLSVTGGSAVQWRLNGVNIDGATGAFLLPETSGMYSVVSTNGTCSAESAAVEFIIGMEDPGQPGDEGGDSGGDDDSDGGDGSIGDGGENTGNDEDGDQGTAQPDEPGGEGPSPIVGVQPDATIPFALETFPVPSNGKDLRIRVIARQGNSIAVKIISASGVVAYSREFDPSLYDGEITVRPEQILSDGMYVVIATQGSLNGYKKIIIKN
jgi:hypothetical protein